MGDLDTATDTDCTEIPFGQRCGDPPVAIEVESVVIHEGFRGRAGFNDIAIIKMEKDVEFSGKIKTHETVETILFNLQFISRFHQTYMCSKCWIPVTK